MQLTSSLARSFQGTSVCPGSARVLREGCAACKSWIGARGTDRSRLPHSSSTSLVSLVYRGRTLVCHPGQPTQECSSCVTCRVAIAGLSDAPSPSALCSNASPSQGVKALPSPLSFPCPGARLWGRPDSDSGFTPDVAALQERAALTGAESPAQLLPPWETPQLSQVGSRREPPAPLSAAAVPGQTGAHNARPVRAGPAGPCRESPALLRPRQAARLPWNVLVGARQRRVPGHEHPARPEAPLGAAPLLQH